MISKPKQLAAFIGLLASSAIMLKFFPAPFIWILLAWGGALFAWGVMRSQTRTGVVVFNFAFLLFALAGVEIWLTVEHLGEVSIVKTQPPGYIQVHPYLGSRPAASNISRITAHYGNELVYDVEYTIGDDGLRLAPPVDAGDKRGCVLFFGGSFMYGAGVADSEALPYQVGVQSGGQYETYNFGFHGHGTNQMLSALEHGYVADRLDCKPTHAVYLAIEDHLTRMQGIGWRSFGPKYVPDASGGVTFAGIFRDLARDHWWSRVIEPRLRKSKLATKVLNHTRPPGEVEFDLFASVVKQSVDIIREDFPEAEFHMLVWDHWSEDDGSGIGDLVRLTKTVDGLHMVSEILPRFHRTPEIYRLHEHGRHPNPLAYEILARYVLEEILEH